MKVHLAIFTKHMAHTLFQKCTSSLMALDEATEPTERNSVRLNTSEGDVGATSLLN
jgi:hypothetical protein